MSSVIDNIIKDKKEMENRISEMIATFEETHKGTVVKDIDITRLAYYAPESVWASHVTIDIGVSNV